MVSREIRRILNERAIGFNIALDDVSITNLTFGREFTAAIEAKQVAAQEAERAKFVVEKAEQDKRSAIIRAQVLLIFQLPSTACVSLCENHLRATDYNAVLLLVVNDQHLILCSLNTDVLQGEAKSAQLIGDAISNNPAFITLRKIEASREIANTISTSQNRVFLSADSLLLNLQDMSVEDVALTSAMKNKK